MSSQFALLKDVRFAPLFVTQFLGAFNDNLLKSYIVVLIAYKRWDIGDMQPEVLVSLAAALFILPFVLFAPYAGELTDKRDKAEIIRLTKLAEIAIATLAVVAILFGSTYMALVVLFAMGAQSAFFAPGKLSILPQHMHDNELIAANGLMSTGTFLAILSGSILGTLIALQDFGQASVCILIIIIAICGYAASRKIPAAPSISSHKIISYKPVQAIWAAIKYSYDRPKGVFAAMLGISWFYFVAGNIHTQFPNFATGILGVDTNVLSLFMVLFSVGIALGGLMNNFILQSAISAKYVVWAALAIAFFSGDIYFASAAFNEIQSHNAELLNISAFFMNVHAWCIVLDLFFLSFCGGLYIVPLRAIVQKLTPPEHIGRVISANTLCDSLFILTSSLSGAVILWLGWSVTDIFILLSGLTIIVAFALMRYKSLWNVSVDYNPDRV